MCLSRFCGKCIHSFDIKQTFISKYHLLNCILTDLVCCAFKNSSYWNVRGEYVQFDMFYLENYSGICNTIRAPFAWRVYILIWRFWYLWQKSCITKPLYMYVFSFSFFEKKLLKAECISELYYAYFLKAWETSIIAIWFLRLMHFYIPIHISHDSTSKVLHKMNEACDWLEDSE